MKKIISHSDKIWLIIALLCFLESAIIASAHNGSRFYLIWTALGVICSGMTFVAHYHLWSKVPHPIQIIIIVSLVLGIALFLFVEGCILSRFYSKGEENLDCIIVLGAQVKENGPSRVLRYRLDAAYDYLESNPETECIVSGGQGYNEPWSEAEGMYRYLTEKGIDPSRIHMENQSTNTVENITFSEQFLDKDTDYVGIVTNNFHVFRSTRLAKHAGYHHISGIASSSHPVFLINNMVREFFGVMKDFLVGNLI